MALFNRIFSKISQLLDVKLTAPVTGQVLGYNSTTSTWMNVNPKTISSASITNNNLILTNSDGSTINAGYLAGLVGPAGPTGPIGLTGPQGIPGVAGVQGPAGATGATGSTGQTGAQGPQGSIGANGAQGPIGLTGATGAAGTNGTNGTNGATGATGNTGPQGPIGNTGPQGSAGATGAQGQQGVAGPTGNTGATGSQGPQGATGPSGPSGVVTASGTGGFNLTYNSGAQSVTLGLATESANQVFAGPSNGSAATPAWRSLVAADIPNLSGSYLPLSGGTLTGGLTVQGSVQAVSIGSSNSTGPGTVAFTGVSDGYQFSILYWGSGATLGSGPYWYIAFKTGSYALAFQYFNGTNYLQPFTFTPDGSMSIQTSLTAGGNIYAAGNITGATVSSLGPIQISNSGAPPTPTSSGFLYVSSGALYYKGSSGTVTLIGAA